MQGAVLYGPLADGTLVPTPEAPPKELIPSLLTLSDVMATGWFAAEAAHAMDQRRAIKTLLFP